MAPQLSRHNHLFQSLQPKNNLYVHIHYTFNSISPDTDAYKN